MSEQTSKPSRPVRNTATLSLSIKPELKEKLLELARKDRRSISTYVSIILEKWMEDHA